MFRNVPEIFWLYRLLPNNFESTAEVNEPWQMFKAQKMTAAVSSLGLADEVLATKCQPVPEEWPHMLRSYFMCRTPLT